MLMKASLEPELCRVSKFRSLPSSYFRAALFLKGKKEAKRQATVK